MSSFLYPKEAMLHTSDFHQLFHKFQADIFCLPQPNYLVASLAIASPAQISGRVSIEPRYLKRFYLADCITLQGRAVLLLLTVPNTAQYTIFA